MNQDEFYKKLSEVCEWRLEDVLEDPNDPKSAYKQVVVDVRQPCPHGAKPLVTPSGRSRDLGCYFTVRLKKYQGRTIWVERCVSCGGLVTPSGKYIDPVDHGAEARAVLIAEGKLQPRVLTNRPHKSVKPKKE